MSSDVIKNPNRNKPKVEIPRASESERLGIIPKPFVPGNYAPISSLAKIAFPKPNHTILNASEIRDFATTENKPSLHKENMIDNNDFVSFDYGEESTDNEDIIDLEPEEEIKSKECFPDVGDYIIMVLGKIIMSGNLELVENKVRDLLYGEDSNFEFELYKDDIIVLKRVDIQVGVFIKD